MAANFLEIFRRRRNSRLTIEGDPLKQGGEFSVEQLIELALGAEHKEGGRPIKMVKEMGSLRLVPKALTKTSQEYYKETGDVGAVIRYIQSGFFFYRQCVNKGFLAPHILVKGAYEWPEPTLFSWDNIV